MSSPFPNTPTPALLGPVLGLPPACRALCLQRSRVPPLSGPLLPKFIFDNAPHKGGQTAWVIAAFWSYVYLRMGKILD